MAKIIRTNCEKCGKKFEGIQSVSREDSFCRECTEILRKEAVSAFLEEWKGNLTLEERVSKIEEWIFQFKKHTHFTPFTPIG